MHGGVDSDLRLGTSCCTSDPALAKVAGFQMFVFFSKLWLACSYVDVWSPPNYYYRAHMAHVASCPSRSFSLLVRRRSCDLYVDNLISRQKVVACHALNSRSSETW